MAKIAYALLCEYVLMAVNGHPTAIGILKSISQDDLKSKGMYFLAAYDVDETSKPPLNFSMKLIDPSKKENNIGGLFIEEIPKDKDRLILQVYIKNGDPKEGLYELKLNLNGDNVSSIFFDVKKR